jgi:hypothetical protein
LARYMEEFIWWIYWYFKIDGSKYLHRLSRGAVVHVCVWTVGDASRMLRTLCQSLTSLCIL